MEDDGERRASTPAREFEGLPAWVTVAEAAVLTHRPEDAVRSAVDRGDVDAAPLLRGRKRSDLVVVRSDDLAFIAEGGIEGWPAAAGADRPADAAGESRDDGSAAWGEPHARRPSRRRLLVGLLLVVGVVAAGVAFLMLGVGDRDGTDAIATPGTARLGDVEHVVEGRWAAAAVPVTNASADRWLASAEVLFTALDAAGSELGRFQTVVSVGPGQTRTAVAQAIDVGSPVADVATVHASLGATSWRPASAYEGAPVEVSGIELRRDGPAVEVKGLITNASDEEFYPEVVCALEDATGAFAGAGLVYVQELDEGSQAPFAVPIERHAPEVAAASCYADRQH
jgi:hypothetical protein